MRMKTWILAAVVVMVATGCTVDQNESIDSGLKDVNSVADGLSDFAKSEGGGWLPGEIRTGLVIASLCASSGLNLWQRVRGKLVRRTGSAVVAAIEGLPGPDRGKVKSAVKTEMISREIYSKANVIVDQLKVG